MAPLNGLENRNGCFIDGPDSRSRHDAETWNVWSREDTCQRVGHATARRTIRVTAIGGRGGAPVPLHLPHVLSFSHRATPGAMWSSRTSSGTIRVTRRVIVKADGGDFVSA